MLALWQASYLQKGKSRPNKSTFRSWYNQYITLLPSILINPILNKVIMDYLKRNWIWYPHIFNSFTWSNDLWKIKITFEKPKRDIDQINCTAQVKSKTLKKLTLTPRDHYVRRKYRLRQEVLRFLDSHRHITDHAPGGLYDKSWFECQNKSPGLWTRIMHLEWTLQCHSFTVMALWLSHNLSVTKILQVFGL